MEARLTHPFTTDSLYLVAVSGGPDSLCLLDLMNQLPGIELGVAHFNHKLRPEADAEAEFVRSLAETMGIPFVLGCADVKAFAEVNRFSIEEAARTLRYRFLFGEARRQAAAGIVTAHTADDQVETILMHLLRGTGMAGLRGMQEVTRLPEFDPQIPLIRPMLQTWREEVEVYCQEHDLKPVHDATNDDPSYFRNRVRLSLIPQLETYNPQFKSALLRMARTVAEDYEAIGAMVDLTWRRAWVEGGEGYIVLSRQVLEEYPAGILRQTFRRAIQSLHLDRVDVDTTTLERVAALVKPREARIPSERVDLAGGLYAFLEKEKVILATHATDLPSAQWPQVSKSMEVTEGEVDLGNGWLLSIEHLTDNWSVSDDPWTAWLDGEQTGTRLTVRPRRAGDRFQPLGMDGNSMKLQDYFTNVKLPKRARAQWPLVCAGDEIAWVAGFRPAHPFRVTERTKQVVKLVLRKV